MTEVWPGILCDGFTFQDDYNNYTYNNQSYYYHIISLYVAYYNLYFKLAVLSHASIN
jgi:hypothetical protein